MWPPVILGALVVPVSVVTLTPRILAFFGFTRYFSVTILIALSGAAFLAALLFGAAGLSPGTQSLNEPQQIARRGLRAGMLAFMAGSAGLAVLWLFGRVYGGTAVGPLWIELPRLYKTMVLCALPCAFFSMVAARIAAAFRPPSATAPDFGESEPASGSTPRTRSELAVSLLLAGGLASPALLPLLEPEPVIARKPAPVAPVPAPEPEAPPPFLYTVPPDLESARPRQFHIADVRMVAGAEASEPLALAPDNRHVAFAVRAGNATRIRVVDLHTLTDTATFPVIGEPRAIAWSPDSNRLAVLRNHPSRPLGIAQRGSGSIIWIERPVAAQLPPAPIDLSWWRDDHIALRGERQSRILDLASLNIDFQGDEFGSYLEERFGRNASQKVIRATNYGEAAPAATSWRMNVLAMLPTFDIGAGHVAPLRSSEVYSHQIAGVDIDSIQPLLGSEEWNRTLLRFADDGSLMVSLSQNGLRVYYIGLHANPPSGFRIRSELGPDPETLDLIEKRALVALICRPLVNSLNGQRVGGDLTRILGLARVSRWDGKEIAFWIDSQFEEIATTDMVACLCSHTGARLIPLAKPEFHKWFATIGEFSSDAECSPPARKVSGASEGNDAPKASRDSPDVIASPAETLPEIPPPTPAAEEVAEGTEDPEPAPPSKPAPSASAPREPTDDEIRKFIIAHHAKKTREDIDGVMRDYAETVLHYHGGSNVTLATIREEQAGLFERLHIAETISGDIRITRQESGIAASYRLRMVGRKQGVTEPTEWMFQTVVNSTSGRLKIIGQRAKQVR